MLRSDVVGFVKDVIDIASRYELGIAKYAIN